MSQKQCNGCGENEEMAVISMSEGAWERNEERHSREKRRLWIAILVLIFMLVGSNVAWLIYESQFVYVEESVDQQIEARQDGAGVNIVSGGDVDYGAES